MYMVDFYLILWGIAFACVVPTLMIGVVYILVSNRETPRHDFTVNDMLNVIKGAKSKDAFTSALNQFKSKFKVLDQKKFDVWISCVKELANSSHWDTDSIAKFGQELEDANSAQAKNISIAIATVLKTKEKK